MGVHTPRTTVIFRSDFWDTASSGPDSPVVVLDDNAVPMTLEHGRYDQGIYSVDVPVIAGCHEYYCIADVGGVAITFPEVGSYCWGAGCGDDDVEAEWYGGQRHPFHRIHGQYRTVRGHRQQPRPQRGHSAAPAATGWTKSTTASRTATVA
jgi:hypothetical protein